jgi:integrase
MASILISSPRKSKRRSLRGLKVDVKVLQELLGPADIRTTLNIYTQTVPDAFAPSEQPGG